VGHSFLLADFRSGLSGSLISRLKLTAEKLKGVVEGIRSLAEVEDPIGKVSQSYFFFI